MLKCGENAQFRTKVCRDGGTAPTWNERFTFPIHRGEREVHLRIWNSNTLTSDKCIGSCVVELDKVLRDEYDDVEVTVMDVKGRQAGLLNVVLTFAPSQTSRPAGAGAQTARTAQTETNGGRFLGVNPKTQRRREEMRQEMLHQSSLRQAAIPDVAYVHVPPHRYSHHPPPHHPPHGHPPPHHHNAHAAYVPKPISGYHEGYTGGPGGYGGYMPPPPGWHQPSAPPSGDAYPEDDIWG